MLCRRVQCRPHQSGDHVRVRGVKGQTIHLHGQVPSFPTSYSETHQCGQEGLLLVHTNTKRAEKSSVFQTPEELLSSLRFHLEVSDNV